MFLSPHSYCGRWLLYVLDADGNPRPEPDLLKWCLWFRWADRCIATAEIAEALISTVFSGIDRRLDRDDRPILFETTIVWKGHDLDGEQDGYATRSEAFAGHEAMVARVRAALA